MNLPKNTKFPGKQQFLKTRMWKNMVAKYIYKCFISVSKDTI